MLVRRLISGRSNGRWTSTTNKAKIAQIFLLFRFITAGESLSCQRVRKMNQSVIKSRRAFLVPAILSIPLLGLLILLHALAVQANSPEIPHLGYGFNVAGWDVGLLQEMGFDWIKVFNNPGHRLPVNVLLRVEAAADDLDDLDGFAARMYQLANNHGPYIEAYEIGNEVNLDADYGWQAPPNAADYVTLLCEAYGQIKAADPQSIVVSAGLAPTGRVWGNWNGHAGHNGFYQDERQYFLEFLDAGGGGCLDVVGYHPYGFSADFDAPPDVASADPTQNCVNGFCFRGVEPIYEMMVAAGLGGKQIWATEFGWLTAPPEHCLSDPGWADRAWQIVSAEKQASNLAGAMSYADANWPWMGVMSIFNLNFNKANYYPECEQMRFYSVQGLPAEDALREIDKDPAPLPARLQVEPERLAAVISSAQQPDVISWTLDLLNDGWQSTSYTLTAAGDHDLWPAFTLPTGTLSTTAGVQLTVTLTNSERPDGVYHGLLNLEATPGTWGAPRAIPMQLTVFEATDFVYLPLIR